MVSFWTRHAPSTLEMLVVTKDGWLVSAVQSHLGEGCRILHLDDPYAALGVLASRPIHGAVLDATLPNRMASNLARAFLQHQPVGRVVIIASPDDMTSIIGLAYGDKRVEVLFRPMDAIVLRATLLGSAMATAS